MGVPIGTPIGDPIGDPIGEGEYIVDPEEEAMSDDEVGYGWTTVV